MPKKYYATLNHRKARVLGYLPGRPVFQPCVATEISEDAFNDPLTKSLAGTGELTLQIIDSSEIAKAVESPISNADVFNTDKPTVVTIVEPVDRIDVAVTAELEEESKPEVKSEQPTQKKRKK